MSRYEPKKPSLCTAGPLTPTAIRESLSVLQGVVWSSYGPFGRLKQIHNGSGGSVVTTSHSSTLLNGISVSHPVLKLLVASVRNHISCYSDCGLFAVNLCCNLVERSLSLNASHHTAIKIIGSLLSNCVDYLNSDDCGCKVAADFGSSKCLLSLTHSVLSSKPACMLTPTETDYISTLLAQAFLSTIPDHLGPSVTLGKCVLVPVEGPSVMESSVVPGLLVETSELSWNRLSSSVGFPGETIKLALFSVSLSGDLCDTGEGNVDLLSCVNPERVMLDQLFALARQLIIDRVDCLMCQKVIHPSLKQYLKEQNILALDRLGAAPMETLSRMTGAKPVASLSAASPACYGRLREMRRTSRGSKHFWHLIPFDTSVSSFVLCNRNETSLKELTATCRASQHILQLTLRKPWVLLGGGCTETHLATYVRYKSSNVQSRVLEELNCSPSEYRLVAECFAASLESAARSLEHDGGVMSIDLQDAHSWSLPPNGTSETEHRCGCGIHQTRENRTWIELGSPYTTFTPRKPQEDIWAALPGQLVLDCFSSKCNALQVAVDTAVLILDLATE
uniref:MKKS centrosomal shuttling protein n=1 Tax=Leptobrachium leishanense TaxID=445787 RepID=A0A8C5PDN8_9ANUR